MNNQRRKEPDLKEIALRSGADEEQFIIVEYGGITHAVFTGLVRGDYTIIDMWEWGPVDEPHITHGWRDAYTVEAEVVENYLKDLYARQNYPPPPPPPPPPKIVGFMVEIYEEDPNPNPAHRIETDFDEEAYPSLHIPFDPEKHT